MKLKKTIDYNILNFDYLESKFSDISKIIDLIQGFEYPFDEEHYKWKYLYCPWGSISIISKTKDIIIGHNGCIIRPFILKNQQTLLGLNSDGIIHEDYRRKGTFSKIEQVTRQHAAEKGVRYNYGFPNKFSFPFSLTVGYENIGYLPIYIKIVHINTVTKRMFKSLFAPFYSKALSLLFYSRFVAYPDTIKVKEVIDYPDSLDQLWDKVLADPNRQFQNIGLRTKNFLEWRFHSCPDRKYRFIIAYDEGEELTGYIVLRETNIEGLRVGIIVDIFHSPFDEKTSTALISYAYDYFIKADVDLIACLISNTATCIPKTLRQFGFRKFIKYFNPRPWPVIIRHTILNKNDHLLLEQKQWYLTWADCDDF